MKQTLKLGKENNGLKLIQVNDGFVIVKLGERVTEGFIIGYGEYSNQPESIIKVTNPKNYSYCSKIIFATPNLNLEGVPEIEERNYLEELLDNFKGEVNYNNYWKPLIESNPSLVNIYKQAQQNLFTEEQVIEAIRLSDQNQYLMDTLHPNEIIELIKKPKVEITFDENKKPIKATLL